MGGSVQLRRRAGLRRKTERKLLGRWAVLARKIRRSYWGGGLGWSESRSEVTGDVGVTGEKAEEGGRWDSGESTGGVTGEVGWAGLKTEAELLGRWAGLG